MNPTSQIYPLFIFILSLSIFSNTYAQDFKSHAAKEALNKYEAAIKKAEEQYKKDLNIALTSAMKSGDLDEANLIKSTIENNLNTNDKNVADVPKDPKAKLITKLSDKHKGMAGATNHNSTYNLVLRAVKGKKVILTIYNMKRSKLSMGEIKLNGEVIGSWELDEKSKEEFDLDITEFVKDDELKEYAIDFKYKGGGDGIVVTEVKATYK